MYSPLVVATEREGLVLRELATEQDDLAYFRSVINSRRHLMEFEPDIVEKYQSLADVLEARTNPSIKDKLRLGIWAADEFAGSINLIPEDDKAEIGYWLDVDHTGNGYATSAVRALSAHGLERHERIYAKVKDANARSADVLVRSGFEQTSHIAGYLIFSLCR